MITIENRINKAIVYADALDSGAEGLIRALCGSIVSEGSVIRIMPDVHAGKGCAVGTTMTIGTRVSPGLVGADIGCGMEVFKVSGRRLEMQKLDKLIREKIPDPISAQRNTALQSRPKSISFSACGISGRIKRTAASAPSEAATILLSWTVERTAHIG